MEINIKRVVPNPYDTREDYGDLEGLKTSIETHGLFQPFLVRGSGKRSKFELAFGGRRLQSCRDLGYKKIAVEVREVSNEDMATLALCENIHRKDLNPVELAKAYRRGLDTTKLSVNAFSEIIGESGVKISSYLNILSLPNRVLNHQERYNTTQLISLGKLENISRNVRVLMEDRIKEVDIGANFLRRIVSSCESIYASRLPDKKKLELAAEVIVHDYSHLPPGNHGYIKAFSDELLKGIVEQHDERVRKTRKSLEKARAISRKKKVKTIKDIIDYDQELEKVTVSLRGAYDGVQRATNRGFYKQASRGSKRKFRNSVNKLTSGLETLLGDEK